MLKTFNEVLATHTDNEIFPQSDPALNQAIKDWYGTRKICAESETDFIRFFRRLYNKDYNQYVQILRIEPGVSDYDWLVQEYRERQRTIDESMSGSATVSKTTSGSVSGTDGKTISGTNGNTRTLNTETQISGTKDGTISDDITKTTDHDRTTSDSSTRTDNLTQTNNSDYTDYNMNHDSSLGLAKTAPMSISYQNNGVIESTVNSVTVDGVTHAMRMESITNSDADVQNPSKLDFSYPDSQTAGDVRQFHRNFGESDDTTHNTGTQSMSRSGSDSIDESVVTDGTRSVSETTGSTKADTGTITDSGTKSETVSGTVSRTTSGADETESENGQTKEGLEREIYTGRNIQIARLLSSASEYIQQTNAFDWFSKQIDVCFYGIYEI